MVDAHEIVLHWFPGTCSRVSLIALEEIGAPFEARLVPRGDADAMTAYTRAVNPKGKVPAVVFDGRVITENTAIVTYLDRVFADAKLLPSDPDTNLDALMMMSWFAAGIHPMITKSRFPIFTSAVPESFDSIKEIAVGNLRDCFGQLEDLLSDGRQWLFGDWTAVDGYLLWLWFRAVGSGLTEADAPLVDALVRRCQERPSATRALDREAQTEAALRAAGQVPADMPPLMAGWLPEPA